MDERENRDVDHDSVKKPEKMQEETTTDTQDTQDTHEEAPAAKIDEETPTQGQEVTAKPPAKKKKGCFKGCLTVFLLFLAVVVIGGVVMWRFVINPPLSPMAKALADTPMDVPATMAVRENLAQSESAEGVFTAVVPLSDERGQRSDTAGSIVLVGIKPGVDFTPAWGRDGMRNQARDIIGGIVEANRQEGLDIKVSSFSFSDEDQAVVTIGVAMDIQEAWIDGRISDETFLENIQVRVDDPGYLVNLVQAVVDNAIARAIRDVLMAPFRR